MGKNNIKNISKQQIVIGIDFGSCGITFAYGFLDNIKKEVFNGQFEEQQQLNTNKISNEIILDEKLENVLSFGNNCINFLSSKKEKKYHHFKHIKMNLYNNIYKIKAKNSNIEVDIQHIISKILKEVKIKAIALIKNYKVNDIEEKDIHWVITVPAIWDIKAKQIMINAAQEAGLIRDDDDPSNFFALEPEAASLYYHHSPHALKEVNFDSGEPFIIFDLGSGTADIVTQRKKIVNRENKFEEVYPPIGGGYGCNTINEKIVNKVMKVLFGEECFNKTKEEESKNNYEDWFEFENKIEQFKKSFNSKEQLKESYRIDCKIFKEYCKEEVDKLIEKFNLKNGKWKLSKDKDWKIYFPYTIINDLMSQLIKDIIDNCINQILENNNIKTLVFTGGASNNPILFDLLKNSNLKILNYVKSPNPEIAIAHGSVLYSYDHNVISPRKAKYTFGLKSSVIWEEEKHKNGGIKKYDSFDKIYRCKNSFKKFITKNENLRPDKEITHLFVINHPKINIELYKTDKQDASFCDERDDKDNLIVTKFGEFIIDVGNDFDISKREVEVKMKMGGTFITATAIYLKTGKASKITCLYED